MVPSPVTVETSCELEIYVADPRPPTVEVSVVPSPVTVEVS